LLRKFPCFNAFYRDDGVHYHGDVNVGLAVNGDQGLKVLVLHGTDTKSVPAITDDLRELLVQYIEDRLPAEVLSGGTFTITNLSGEGVFDFYPLMNKGQSAILSVGSEITLPGCSEGFFSLGLTFDHQVSDGREAARFVNELRARLAGHEQAPANNPEPYCSQCLIPHSNLTQGSYLMPIYDSRGKAKFVCSLCLGGW
jgi:2-oxoglutarate dehydrogenase E2 component (dihydrolipoamide succinyltransferase)